MRAGDPGWDDYKARRARQQRALSASGRDIGPIPAVEDEARRESCRLDLKLFCETYFAPTFDDPWSDAHLKVLSDMESAALHGTKKAIAMPRGSGKTSMAEACAIWAVLYGHRIFPVLIGATATHADELLDSVKTALQTNEILAEDFPEVCYPVARLEGMNQRATGQTCEGVPTRIRWTQDGVMLPTIKGSPSSGSIIRVASMTGRIRGMKARLADGRTIRPDLVLPDDPQTDESAASVTQTTQRIRKLSKAIEGLAGPGKSIAAIMPLTIINQGDLADQLLDRKLHPEWRGEVTKMLTSLPTDEERWEKYAEVYRDELAGNVPPGTALAFYKRQWKKLEAGAVASWPARYNKEQEFSAIHHAMNLKIKMGDYAWYAEYQNEPQSDIPEDSAPLTAEQITRKYNRMERGLVPNWATRVTAFVDVQERALYWMVCAWSDDMTGAVVDYGTWPKQPTRYFALRNIKRTMKKATEIPSRTGAIYKGLEVLTGILIDHEWEVDGGDTVLNLERILVDAAWGPSTDTVHLFCRQNRHGGVVMPSIGKGVTASMRPFDQYTKKQGERIGLNWRVPKPANNRVIRHVLYDTNWWKSQVYEGLGLAMGEDGCISLYGKSAQHHQLLAEHLTQEYRIKTEGHERTLYEWKQPPNKRDNHWWDCLVGCAVGASMGGSTPAGVQTNRPVKKRRRRRRKLSEIQAEKRSQRAGVR